MQITAPRPLPSRACDWLLAPPPGGEAADRLAVYRDGYPTRIAEALAESFPATAHLIGHGALHALATRYGRKLALGPGRHSLNLNDVGFELPAFLHDDPLTTDLPFLPDLAELEWRMTRAFHARAEAPLAPESLATLAPEETGDVVLRFAASVAVVASAWPIHALWQARDTPIEEIDLEVRDRPESVLVYRDGFDVACRLLGPLEAECLRALLARARLGDVTAALEDRVSEETVTAWFGRWMSLGIVVGVELAPRC